MACAGPRPNGRAGASGEADYFFFRAGEEVVPGLLFAGEEVVPGLLFAALFGLAFGAAFEGGGVGGVSFCVFASRPRLRAGAPAVSLNSNLRPPFRRWLATSTVGALSHCSLVIRFWLGSSWMMRPTTGFEVGFGNDLALGGGGGTLGGAAPAAAGKPAHRPAQRTTKPGIDRSGRNIIRFRSPARALALR